MKLRYFVFVWLLSIETILARPAEIILLRHAEKPADETNVHLSPQGKERARALVRFLTTTPALVTNGLPVALFATRPTPRGHGSRTAETLEPLAKHLELQVKTPYPASDYAALAEHVLHDPHYEEKTVVICWVHDYLPELASALGVKQKNLAWKSSVFDQVWVITYKRKKTSLLTLHQHILPNDASP